MQCLKTERLNTNSRFQYDSFNTAEKLYAFVKQKSFVLLQKAFTDAFNSFWMFYKVSVDID